jgi:plasmid stabilization system protein ParE
MDAQADLELIARCLEGKPDAASQARFNLKTAVELSLPSGELKPKNRCRTFTPVR